MNVFWLAVLLAATGSSFRQEGISFERANVSEGARVYLPVEIEIQAQGRWTNPFDPGEVSVSARVVGPREVAADVPAFWFEGYEWRDGRLSPTGVSGWRLRFAPWSAGGYALFIRGFDLDGPGELPKVGFDVRSVPEGNEPPGYGFVEPVKDRPAFTSARREPFVPVGVYLDSLPLAPTDIQRLVARAVESGANFISAPVFEPGWALESESLLSYNQQAAHRLDVLLAMAQEQGVHVLLRLEGGRVEPGALPASLGAYSIERGGPCRTLDEFWSSLRARQIYKKKLRYIVARNAWRSSMLGLQFFEGVAPPSWWLDEMAQLVYDLHPYLVVQAAERTEQVAGDSLRLNLAVLSSGADLRRWRERSKKPALLIPSQGPADVRQAWRDLMTGASGAMTRGFPARGSLAPLRDAAHQLPWTTAPVDAQRVESLYPFSASLLSDSVALLYVEGSPTVESTLPQMLRIPIRRDGTYEVQWSDALTGEALGEPSRQRYRESAVVPVPRFESAAFCVLRRVGR